MELSIDLKSFLESEHDDSSLHLSAVAPIESNKRKFGVGKKVHDDKEEETPWIKSAPQDQLGSKSIFSPYTDSHFLQHHAHNKPVISPPFVMPTPFKSPEPTRNDNNHTPSSILDIDISDFLLTAKKEIMNIYQSLSENTDLDESTISSKADEATLVHMMNTNKALLNTLQTTYIHAKSLQEETHRLQEENILLKIRLNNLQSPSYDNDTTSPMMMSDQRLLDKNSIAKSNNQYPSQQLTQVYNLNTSDVYVKRSYSEVVKSPGTVSGNSLNTHCRRRIHGLKKKTKRGINLDIFLSHIDVCNRAC